MNRWFEPELNNNFDFIFNKIEDGVKVWYIAYVYADEYAFKYDERTFQKEVYYTKYLKPNYHHEIICKVYELIGFDEDSFWSSNDDKEECSHYNQMIEFNTNEHGEIDLENIEFYDY